MFHIKEHIVVKLLVVLMVILLLTPTGVKFTHIFNHHTHKVCEGELSTHIHQVDLDCDFFKFKINKSFTYTIFKINFFTQKKIQLKITPPYLFLSEYQQLHFSLRGPPQFNLS